MLFRSGNCRDNGWKIMLSAADKYPQNHQKRRRDSDGALEPEEEEENNREGEVEVDSGEQKAREFIE